jgi:hypothetical protein
MANTFGSRIAAILTLFSGLFAARNEPPPVPLTGADGPAHARAYAPRRGTCPARRSYGLPTGGAPGGTRPGSWGTDHVGGGRAGISAAKRRSRDARRALERVHAEAMAMAHRRQREIECERGRVERAWPGIGWYGQSAGGVQ